MTAWSLEAVNALADQIDAGASQTQAARRLKRTKGSIAGKADRLGWGFGRPLTEEQRNVTVLKAPRPAREPRESRPLYPCAYSIRMDPDLNRQIDAYAARNTMSRAEAIRTLLTIAFVELGED